MKKRIRVILLLGIYGMLLVFTLTMEWLGVREPGMRAAINLGTLGMAVVGAALFALVYRSGGQVQTEAAEPADEKRESACVFDRERYLAFAAECGFTRRETEVGLLVANGYSNLRIAEELFISETTVKKHITHIYEKSGIGGRKAFIEYFCGKK